MKILIVDDEPGNIALLFAFLKDDYEVLMALNGFEALRVVEDRQPDLVLLDIMMPDMNGLDVCRRLREDPRLADMPIIFVTALDSLDEMLRGLELGAVDYITKPLNLALTRVRIRNQVELKRQRNLVRERNDDLARRNAELEAALGRVKRLEGLIAICMQCKKVRTEGNAWQRIEQYIGEHSDARFSHGLCPECYEVEKARLG